MTKLSTMNECTSVPPVSTLEMTRRHDIANTAQWRGFRALHEATGRRHRASIHVVLLRRTKGSQSEKNDEKAPYLSAVSLALAVRRYDIKHIAQWRGSRATTEATGRCHRGIVWAWISSSDIPMLHF
jgi:hypothetical protein